MVTTEQVRAALGAGWQVREGSYGGRLLLAYEGRLAGYLEPGDDGKPGSCLRVTFRSGIVAEAIRKAGITV